MNTIQINFKEPKIKSLIKKTNKYGQTTKIVLQLDWGYMGMGLHTIYKKDGKYVFTDKQSPLPIRKFMSISDMMWEYELPKSLKVEFEKLV
jgi:hypothetical protein